jgi:CRP-like cAMP-binding protein
MGDRDATILIRKLRALHSISEEEEAALVGAISQYRDLKRGATIAADGSTPQHSTAIISGVACRYKILDDGRRQILCFQYPGDVTDLYSYVLKRLDHTVGTITACTVAHIPHENIARLSAKYPNLAYALWRDSLVDTSMLNMAIVNNGRRSAPERIAHLLCEQFVRLAAVGLAQPGKSVALQITQTDIADATGLSLVHVNKTLRNLKQRGLIGKDPSQLDILSWEGLKAAAGFDPGYLHFKNINGR